MTIDTKMIGGRLVQAKQIDRDGLPIGIVEGYIATWDLDRGDYWFKDQFVKGCFADSIAEFKANKRMPRFKDGHRRTVGGWLYDSLREDDRGLFGIAEINLDVQQGKEAYSMAKQGVLTDFSIGFMAEEFITDEINKIRTITKAELVEGSIVDEPMNPKANITAVKVMEHSKNVKALTEQGKEVCQKELVSAAIIAHKSRVGVDIDSEEKTVVINELNDIYKTLGRSVPFDGNTLTLDSESVKHLTERQIEGMLSLESVKFSTQASKALISCLNLSDLRDADGKDTRDAKNGGSEIEEKKMDEIITLLEK